MQTKAYSHFRPAWDQFVATWNFNDVKIESEARFLLLAADAAEDFMLGDNTYVKALSANERKCIRDVLFVLKRFLRLQADDSAIPNDGQEKSVASQITGSLNRRRKKASPGWSFIEEVLKKKPRVIPDDIQKAKLAVARTAGASFMEAFANFMGEIDAFAAENARIEVEIPKQPPFGKRTLNMLQEALGVLRSISTEEAGKEAERLERYLRSEGATVVWPPRDLDRESEEFFVVAVPGVETPKDVQPFIQYKDIRLRGEKIIPGN
jgi:hypothetical protein